MFQRIKQKLLSKQMIPYYLIILFAFLVGFPLFRTKMLNGHDAIFHLFRHNSTLVAIKDGELIPMINPDMMGGFGYGANLFYGVLSTYIVGIFQFFCPTLGSAINLLTFLTILLSGVFMFWFAKDITKHDSISLLIAILYMIGPYHLYDIYIRSSIGEVISFVFVPLVFHGIYQIIKGDPQKWYFLTIGTAGLFLTHNVSTLLTAIFAFLYLLFHLKEVWKRSVLCNLIKALLLALFLSLPTIGPLLEVKHASDYMVFDPEYMHTTGTFMQEHGISLTSSFFHPLNLSFWLLLIMAIFGLIVDHRQKNSYPFLILGIVILIFTLDIIPWNLLPQIFSLLQFPWRLLQYALFFISIGFGIALLSKFKHISYPIIIGFCSFFLIFSIPLIIDGVQNVGIDNQLVQSNKLKLRGDIVRSTGTASAEYLPRKAIYSYTYLKNHPVEPTILNGEGTLTNIEKNGTHLTFQVTMTTNGTIELPYIYYPGYQVKINDQKISTFETDHGLIGIEIESGTWQITSFYRGTPIMIVSYLSFIIASGTLIWIIFKQNRTHKI